MVDILTLNYNDSLTTIAFVNKVIPYSIVSRVIVVDNNSTDDSYNNLSQITSEKVHLIKSSNNGGYGAGNNYGINYAKKHLNSKYILLANPDVIIEEDAVIQLLDYISQNAKCAIVAPFMCDINGDKQTNSAFRLPSYFQYAMSLNIVISKIYAPMRYKDLVTSNIYALKVGCVSGSCFMLDVDKFMEVKGFDENIFLYCEEVVIGNKMNRAGYDTILLPQVTFIHHHSVTISKSIASLVNRKRLLYNSKLYVLKEYYNASPLSVFFLKLSAGMSLFVLRIKELLR